MSRTGRDCNVKHGVSHVTVLLSVASSNVTILTINPRCKDGCHQSLESELTLYEASRERKERLRQKPKQGHNNEQKDNPKRNGNANAPVADFSGCLRIAHLIGLNRDIEKTFLN